MDNNNPDFIKCAMDAIEQGFKAKEVKQECACHNQGKTQLFNKNGFNTPIFNI